MKTRYLLPALLMFLLGCGRFSNKDAAQEGDERLVCLSKQYNEIIFALGAQKNLVAVDLSSTYPPAIKELPTVGYHRALSAEGILATHPTLILHDNNVGPEPVMKQLSDLKIPMKVFDTKGEDIESTKKLISEMGVYFHHEKQADSLNEKLDRDMKEALAAGAAFPEKIKVVVIHFGRAMNAYFTFTSNNTGGRMIEWAGGVIPVEGDRGMMPLSAEVIAKADPDVIILTDFGYDRLGPNEINTLPGVSSTRAAKNNRIYRVEEHDLVYIGPRTGENVKLLQQLIHQDGSVR